MRPASSTGFLLGLLLVGAACSGEQPSEPTAVAATGILAVAGDGQQAVVAEPVPTPPRVRVGGPDGRPLVGVTVTFEVTSGGGSITGATATTGVDGRASVGSWTLGTDDGPQTLTATSGGESVVITARSIGGPVALIEALPGGVTSFSLGAFASPVPGFRMFDAYGNPVPHARVLFTLEANAEAVTPVVSYTDSNGVARAPELSLASTGPQTLVATAANGTRGSLALTGVAPDGCVQLPHRIGALVEARLSVDDCDLYGTGSLYQFDSYSLTLAVQTAFDVRLSGAGLRVRDAAAPLPAPGGAFADVDLRDQATARQGIRYVLPAGTYLFRAESDFLGSSGIVDYVLQSARATAAATRCGAVVTIVPGVVISDTLSAAASCADATRPGALLTRYYVAVPAGRSAIVALRSTAFLPTVQLRLIPSNDAAYLTSSAFSAGQTTATIVVPSYLSAPAYSAVVVTTTALGASGAYTLTVTLQ